MRLSLVPVVVLLSLCCASKELRAKKGDPITQTTHSKDELRLLLFLVYSKNSVVLKHKASRTIAKGLLNVPIKLVPANFSTINIYEPSFQHNNLIVKICI